MFLYSTDLLQVNLFLIAFMATLQLRWRPRPESLTVLTKIFLIPENDESDESTLHHRMYSQHFANLKILFLS